MVVVKIPIHSVSQNDLVEWCSENISEERHFLHSIGGHDWVLERGSNAEQKYWILYISDEQLGMMATLRWT